VSLQENALRNTAVFNSILQDVKSIIIKVIVNSAFSDAVVFIRILNNWLLEIGLEVQNLLKSR
jgi:hypothetical protein